MTKSEHGFSTVYCQKCGHEYVAMLNCGDRTCGVCRRRAWGIHWNAIKPIVKTWPMVRFLTLTMRNIPDETVTRDDVKFLRDSFTKLRHTKAWSRWVQGGFYFFHVTNQGRGWHIHLHVLYTGYYIPQNWLSKTWKKITRTSYIVDVRACPDPEKGLHYLLADLLRPPDIKPEHHTTFNDLFYRTRLVQGFGECSPLKLRSVFLCPVCGYDQWWSPAFDGEYQKWSNEPAKALCLVGPARGP